MHEMSVIENLIPLLKRICEEQKAYRVVSVQLRIHPYSCLDQESLNFMFSCIAENEPRLKDTKIKVVRSSENQEREYIVDNVELEIE
jgi:Zn finger protein HypA/HybF involved in hydrogenase expression